MRTTLAYIALCVTLLVLLGTCERKDGRKETRASRADSLLRADSLRMMELESQIAKYSDIIEQQEAVINDQKARLAGRKTEWREIAIRSDNDTVLLADTIIQTQDSIIEEQRVQIAYRDSTAEMLSKGLDYKDGVIAELAFNVEELEYNLQKAMKRTWWDRNKVWVGLIGGMAAGAVGGLVISY